MANRRRETLLSHRRAASFQRDLGQVVRWACFDPVRSVIDTVYDVAAAEGRRYFRPFLLPVLTLDVVEGNRTYDTVRLDPTDASRLAISSKQFRESAPADVDWRDDDARIKDIFVFDGQVFALDEWEIMGKTQGDDLIIGVRAAQVYDWDFVNDPEFPFAL